MEIFIDCNGSAKEEIELTLEFNPPPQFKKVDQGIDWALENLPRGVYFELQGKNGRVFYSGFNGARK